MLRRKWNWLVCASCLVGVVVVGGPISVAADRPNVVLVMADDLGWGETGYHGHPHVRTPVLDQMAQSALRLERFYAASPVCSPTRASVMTGRHANRSGAFAPNWSTRPEEITIAHVLQQAGYRTGHFGKWHLGAVKEASPVNPRRMGFDEYLSHDNFFEMNPLLSRNGQPPTVIQGEGSAVVAAEAIRFVRGACAAQQPFFVVLWFGSPHGPYSGLAEDIALYAQVPKTEMQLRFAEITAMDRALGDFRGALKELGVSDNTLLWFNSDNGIPVADEKDSFNGGWRGRKGDVHEGGLRVPGIVEWPKVIQTSRVSEMPCVTSDIMPTILELLHLQHPQPQRPMDGVSLKELIVGGDMQVRPKPIGFWRYDAAGEKKNEPWISPELSLGTTPTTKNPAIQFTNYRHPVAKTEAFGGAAAWTDNRYKLVVTRAQRGSQIELFDLLNDPYEKKNLAADMPDQVEVMQRQLHDWQRSVERSLSGADYQKSEQR